MQIKFVITLVICIVIAYGQIPSIDADMLQKYKKLQDTKSELNFGKTDYIQTEIQTEDSITITQPIPTIGKPTERQFGSFIEPVVVNGDTIQILTKALPKELKYYSANLFSTIITDQIVLTNVIGPDYVLGAGDRLNINIWGDVNVSHELTISNEGTIFIPKAGELMIAGKTIGNSEKQIKRFLSKIYSNFKVSLSIQKTKNIKVYVIGEANKPGSYLLSGLSNVFNALDLAGGPNEIGTYRDIRIIRNKKIIAKIDLYEFLRDGIAPENINLTTNDIIFIPPRKGLVKLRGAVLNPAQFEIKNSSTIEDIILLAGNLLPQANNSTINIDRVSGQNYHTVTIQMSDSLSKKTVLKNGDDISVFTKNPIRKNSIFLRGHLEREGTVHFDSTESIKDLFTQHKLLLDDTYLQRIDLIRTTENQSKQLIPINVELALKDDPRHNVLLEDNDLIIAFSIWNFKERESVTIKGAVRNSGEYPLFEDMTIHDLIFIAGGLLDYAYFDNAEIFRFFDNKNPDLINIDIGEIINNPLSPENFELLDKDVIFVRKHPSWREQRLVTIEGEVKFPGEYALLSESEKLSDLLRRAGGFTENAFSTGVFFRRTTISDNFQQRNLQSILKKTMPIEYDSLGRQITIDFNNENLNRIIIDIDDLDNKNKQNDIVLENGDWIQIPKTPSGVSIKGAVAFEGTIKFIENKRLGYYINGAGGILKNGDKSEIRIVKYNGKTVKVSMNYRKIEPGDIIVVPFKKESEKNFMKGLMDTVSILSSLATTIYILIQLK